MSILIFLSLYLLLGLLLVPIITSIVNRRDKDASNTTWRVKWLFVPGYVLIWPLLCYTWWREKARKLPQSPIRTQLTSWIILAFVLPSLISLALYYRPKSPFLILSAPQINGTVIRSGNSKSYTITVVKYDAKYRLEIQPTEDIIRPDQSVFITIDQQKRYVGKIMDMKKTVFDIVEMRDSVTATITILDQISNNTISKIEF